MYKHYFTGIDSVQAIFTNRHDGYSSYPFSSLNLGLRTGDDIETVQLNREKLFDSIGFLSNQCAYADQVHSETITIVNQSGISPNTDALITNQLNLPVIIQVADCACVLLVDPKRKVIAAVHAGWRGAAKGIVHKTIDIMKTEFLSEPADIQTVISPCISAAVFEVGEDVYQQFDDKYFTQKSLGKWFLDLKTFLIDQLKNSGVHSIQADDDCTFLNESDYFSYRRDGQNSGRMMGLICLR